MKEKFLPYYLTPHTIFYQVIDKIDQYKRFIFPIILLIALAYPITQSISLTLVYKQQKDLIETIEQEIKKKEEILNHKKEENRLNNSKDITLSKINQQLEDLFHQYQIEINSMQWHLEQDKIINLTLTQNANNLFNLIIELNQHPLLYFKEITFTRLDYQHLIQLNAIVQLTEK